MPERPRLRLIEGGGGPAGRLAPASGVGPALELAALGVGLTLTAALMGRMPDWARDLGTFQGLYVLCFAFYGLALLRLPRYATLPRAGLAVFAVALAARAALLPSSPSLSDDIYRYVWEGRVVVHGGNPYRQNPLDPSLEPLRDREVYPHINHKHLSTIYPPLAMGGFALVGAVSSTPAAFKLWITLHDLLLIAVLLAWARRRGSPAVSVIAYAWNPLVLVEFAGTGHNDPTALLWLVLALMWADSRPTLSALALATGALVKLAPVVALPFLLRRWPWRARLSCLAALGAGLSWYGSQTREAQSGLLAYWEKWRNNELLFHFLERWTGDFHWARGISLVLVAAALAWAWWKAWSPASATRLGMRAALLTSPVMHPWYLGWVLVFEPLGASAPWLLLSLTSTLNYGLFAAPAAGSDFHLPLPWRWVEYGIPLGVAVALAGRRLWPRRGIRSGKEATT